MASSLTGSIASFPHFRQARFDSADEKRHRLLNCEATRLPYRRGWPALRKWRRNQKDELGRNIRPGKRGRRAVTKLRESALKPLESLSRVNLCAGERSAP